MTAPTAQNGPATQGNTAITGSPLSPLTLARTPVAQIPPYALEPVRFSFPALAEFAQSAALGGDREMALAAMLVARLIAAALPPVQLESLDRATRAERARAWLSALTMPQPARMAFLRSVDASVASGMDAAASLRELMNVLTGHMSPAGLQELGGLAESLRLYYEQTP